MSGGAATLRRRRRISPRRAAARLGTGLSPRRAVRRISPRLRRRALLAVVVCLVLAAAYQLWLRDSSFVSVDRVTITGLTTDEAERVRAALTASGRTMTTLHLDQEALERAVSGFPVVRELEVRADFPHGLRVHVVEYHPAAMAVSGGGRIPVAGDGTILRGLPVEGRLPTVDVDGPLGVDRLRDRTALAAAAVAGAAPAPLRARVTEVERRAEDGLVATLRDGPELIFGDASRPRAKWAAAARVLADLEARGASYIDVRIPSRPAAGGLPAETVTPVAPASAAPTVPSAGATAAPTDTTITGQAAADPTGTTPPPTTTTAPPATGTAPTQPTTPTQPTAPQTAPETPVTGGTEGGATATP